MSRPLSTAARHSAFGQETDQVWIVLVTVAHPALAAPFRVASAGITKTGDNWVVTSRGNTWIWFPFEITLPSDREDGDGKTRIVIDNVDRDIVAALRATTDRAEVTIEIVLHSQPDTIEDSYDCLLTAADWDALTIEGELSFDWRLSEVWPYLTFSPALFPGLFL